MHPDAVKGFQKSHYKKGLSRKGKPFFVPAIPPGYRFQNTRKPQTQPLAISSRKTVATYEILQVDFVFFSFILCLKGVRFILGIRYFS